VSLYKCGDLKLQCKTLIFFGFLPLALLILIPLTSYALAQEQASDTGPAQANFTLSYRQQEAGFVPRVTDIFYDS
jgi:hypothetical protein